MKVIPLPTVPLPSVKPVNKSTGLPISDTSTEPLDIALIEAAAFSRLNTRKQHQDNVQLFSMTVQEMEKVLAEWHS